MFCCNNRLHDTKIISIFFEMKVITDGAEQFINLLAKIHLSSSRTLDMKSCLLHRVTKLAKLQLGPIKVMKVVQQHNNTNTLDTSTHSGAAGCSYIMCNVFTPSFFYLKRNSMS